MKRIVSTCFYTVCFLSLLSSCNRLALLEFIKPPKSFEKTAIPQAADYSNSSAWHLPELQKNNKKVDCFFIHPTTYIMGKNWNQDINDSHVNWRTRVLPIRYQAVAFRASCNVYIPKYRQAVFYAFKALQKDGKKALEIAYKDVRSAFYNYIQHHNRGKAFVLAAHSQGAKHGQRLLAEIMQDSNLRKLLVVAYLPGWPMIQDSMLAKDIAVCSTAQQTTCMVSWNTEAANNKLSLVDVFASGQQVVCVNPISWTTDHQHIDKTHNKGALQLNKRTKKDEIILHYCDAQIVDNVLQIHPPSNQRSLQMPMGKGNYHLYDYNFFYQNIKNNVADRIEAFFSSKNVSKQEDTSMD